MALAAGTEVGPYVVDGFVDAGGMGEVYSATDPRLGRRVALKVLPAEMAQKAEYRRRFDREIQAISRVTHKNICTLYDTGLHDGQPFIAMEYLEGRTLEQALQTDRFEIEQVIDVAIQVVSALQAAHRHGIVHRDIKPSNIILSEHGDVKVLDFGIAKAVQSRLDSATAGELTTEGVPLGTLSFMSPEQAAGHAVDVRSDLFSMGMVLYLMVTGQLPFAGAPAVILSQLTSAEPVPRPVHLRPSVPSELDRIVCRMLEKDPSMRYQTAGDLLAALRALRRDYFADRVRQPAVTPETAHRLSRRTRGAWAAVVTVAGLVIAVGVFGSGLGNTGPIRSIAVVPCDAPSDDASGTYYCDLMAEVIRRNLRTFLTVASPLQVDALRRGQQSPIEIARQLGQDAVLTAQVLGETVLIDVTDVRSSESVWSDTFQGARSAGQQLHNVIAQGVAGELQLQLSDADQEQVRLQRLYNEAEYFAGLRTGDDLQRAIELYRQIIADDPDFADAYAGLAYALVLTPYWAGARPDAAYPEATRMARAAIDLQATNAAQAHAALGLSYRDYERDWAAADLEFRRALELDAQHGTALQWYAELLAGLSEFDRARERIGQARAASPLDRTVQGVEGWILLCEGRVEEARTLLASALERDPDFLVSNWFFGQLHFAAGDYTAAIEAFEVAAEVSDRGSRQVADLASAYALSGNRARAEDLLAELASLEAVAHVSGYEYAIVHAAMGDPDEAIRRLEEAIQGRDTWQVVNMGIDPMLAPLRIDPRFTSLLAMAGLE